MLLLEIQRRGYEEDENGGESMKKQDTGKQQIKWWLAAALFGPCKVSEDDGPMDCQAATRAGIRCGTFASCLSGRFQLGQTSNG